jgi:starch synthase
MHVVLIEFGTSTPYPIQLANALGQLCQVTLLLPERASVFADKTAVRDKINLQFFHMPQLRDPANLVMVRQLRRQIRGLRPDLVHITFWNLWGTPGLGLSAPFPLVATVHDVNRHLGERGLWAIPSFLYRWQWRWADQIIVHATTARQQLLAQYGCQPERVHVIPIGSFDLYGNHIEMPEPERPNTILFFGRIWRYKGLQYLVEAEPLITQAVPDARIIIAGQGEPIEKYRQAMVNPDHFEIHNYRIPDEQVAHFFQQASVVALPYLEASQSGVASVAYAFGKPVVATPVGGLPDVVTDGETGLLVPSADAHSLAEAIIMLLKDTARRRRMGENARRFAETELSWGHIAQKTLAIYERQLAN